MKGSVRALNHVFKEPFLSLQIKILTIQPFITNVDDVSRKKQNNEKVNESHITSSVSDVRKIKYLI